MKHENRASPDVQRTCRLSSVSLILLETITSGIVSHVVLCLTSSRRANLRPVGCV